MECPSCLMIIFTALLAYLTYTFLVKKNSKYPPGPTGIPFLGSFFSVGREPHLKFAKWAKKYGPVFSVKLGEINAVVLNDAKSIRDAFKEDAFSGRPANKFFLTLGTTGKRDGVIMTEGPEWVEQRRFVLRGLRDFGFGKQSMESIIMTEVDECVEWLKQEAGKPISLNRKFHLTILNSIWMIVCGRRYKHDDPALTKLFDGLNVSLNDGFSSGFMIFLEKLSTLAPGLFGWNKLVEVMDAITKVFKDEIREHERTFVETNPCRDLVDLYLSNIKSTTDKKSTFYKEKGYDQLQGVMSELFGAGSQTTSTTITWSVLYLATNPKVQKKLQEELDRVVGKNRLPTLADKTKLPYTEAVMNEVFRVSSIVPTSVFHSTMRDVTFQGYEIPKDTYIIANTHGVHHDPEVWGDPENFRPERFLSSDEKTIVKSENLMAFSVGKRVCLGESLARDEFFLFLACIFQRFDVRTEKPIHEVLTDPIPGFLLQAKEFKVIMKDRIV